MPCFKGSAQATRTLRRGPEGRIQKPQSPFSFMCHWIWTQIGRSAVYCLTQMIQILMSVISIHCNPYEEVSKWSKYSVIWSTPHWCFQMYLSWIAIVQNERLRISCCSCVRPCLWQRPGRRCRWAAEHCGSSDLDLCIDGGDWMPDRQPSSLLSLCTQPQTKLKTCVVTAELQTGCNQTFQAHKEAGNKISTVWTWLSVFRHPVQTFFDSIKVEGDSIHFIIGEAFISRPPNTMQSKILISWISAHREKNGNNNSDT